MKLVLYAAWCVCVWPVWSLVSLLWLARPGPGWIAACWWTIYRYDAAAERRLTDA